MEPNVEIITALANALACNDAILSLQAFVEDSSEESGAPDFWTACHIHEQWLHVVYAFPAAAEA